MGLAGVKRYNSILQGVTEFWLVNATDDEAENIKRIPGVVGEGDVLPNIETLTTNCGTSFNDDFQERYNLESTQNISEPVATEVFNVESTEVSLSSVKAFKSTRVLGIPTRAPHSKQIIMQRNTPQDLDLVSWPSGTKLPGKLMEGYVYNATEGIDTYIYVIGEGLNYIHSEFAYSGRHREGRGGRYFGPNAPYRGPFDFRDESNPPGYSSCTASKAAGWRDGVSKNSKIIVLKTTMSLADNTWAFAKVLDDVIAKDLQGKSVILYPRSSHHPPDRNIGWTRIKLIMERLMRQDVIIVGCAGDDALQPQKPTVPNKYPASWASDNFPLIVAGAVTLRGDYAKFSQGNNRSISHNIAWAPGDPVICASAEGYMYQQGRGTGIAAGMVAGLAAYLIRHWPRRQGFFAADMRRNIYDRSSRPIFPRYEPRVIWNFQDGSWDPNPRII